MSLCLRYNCISLGFTLLAATSLLSGPEIVGSMMFCLALNYKHQSVKQFGSRSGTTSCRAWSGSKLFAKVISRQRQQLKVIHLDCLFQYNKSFIFLSLCLRYNCISLGFTLLAATSLLTGREIVGSMLFCLALNYKQMELYHALPFFCYLLGSCWQCSWCKGWVQKSMTYKLGLKPNTDGAVSCTPFFCYLLGSCMQCSRCKGWVL